MEECPYDVLWHRSRMQPAPSPSATTCSTRWRRRSIARQAAPDADAALSATSPDTSPDPDDGTRGGPPGRVVADDDLYHPERDPDQTDEEYQERCRMLGCDESGHIRLPRRQTMRAAI
jgi:hypothetical protein